MTFLHQPAIVTILSCLAMAASGHAEDVSKPVAVSGVAAAESPQAPSRWSWQGRLGGFAGNVTSENADASRDPTISDTTDSTSWLATIDAGLGWKAEADSVDNALKARFGRIHVDGGAWVENNDEIRYDGVHRREVYKPTFVYQSWGAESVFTGPAPRTYAFDPTLGKAGVGVGQRVEALFLDHDQLPDRNQLEWRLGARAQKYWGKSLAPEADGVQTGAEAYLRYDHDLIDQSDPEKKKTSLRFFAQYEGFSEFNDLSHAANLITAGLTIQLSRYLGAELGLRAYYETRTKEDDGTLPGYNQWSVRQDTLIGLTCLW